MHSVPELLYMGPNSTKCKCLLFNRETDRRPYKKYWSSTHRVNPPQSRQARASRALKPRKVFIGPMYFRHSHFNPRRATPDASKLALTWLNFFFLLIFDHRPRSDSVEHGT
ncbi:hypothetical protein BS17DRAFT_47122 [Gyrodon lividus]|nr:hypothetical protein BS17DRAFT_47122 [Gyrodon lividus]